MQLGHRQPAGVLEKVAYNIADVGVGPAGGREVDPRVVGMCDVEVLSRDALVVVLPKGHRLARASIVRPEDLAGETLVSLDSTSTTAEMVSSVLFQSGVPFRRTVTAANGVGVCALVALGVGVAEGDRAG